MKYTKTDTAIKMLVYISLYIVTISIFLSIFFLVPDAAHQYRTVRLIIIFFCSLLLVKYFFYMVISPWYDVYLSKISRKVRIGEMYQPLVSILVPAWNESSGIIRTIKTILKSTYRNIELVVINDGSTDKSHSLVHEFIKENETNKIIDPDFPIRFRYIYQENTGKGGALNNAIKNSSGDILITIDADCLITPTTIENFVRHFHNKKVMAVVGNVKVANTNNIIGVVQHLEFLFSFYFKKADSIMNTIYIIGGAAGAFRREVFEKIGNFNTVNITEDIDLSVRIQKAGMKIVYASDAVVYTEGASDLAGLLKQRLRWKRGRLETFIKHHEIFFSTNKNHNKFLSWIILPYVCIAELQLTMELGFIVFLYVYSYLSGDFSSFVSGITVVASMFVVQLLFDSTEKKTLKLYMLAPIGWLLFYATTIIEVMALGKTVTSLMFKKEIKWQTWKRVGIQI